jgi:CobQ-like glutamine amidotransferase family enzyme
MTLATSAEQASRVIGEDNVVNTGENPSRRLHQTPQGFEYHLEKTPITYNFNEEEINVLIAAK